MNAKEAIGGAAAVGAAALAGCTAYARRYKLTKEDRQAPLLGDDYYAKSNEPFFDGGGCAIDIDAPAEVVWQHIKQMGTGQAGWYSFEHLERLFTFDIHNHYTIHPEWQNRQKGDFLFYHQPPLGIGSLVTEIDEDAHQMATVSDSRKEPTVEGSLYLTLPGYDYFSWTWNFAVIDKGNGKSRYITKAQVGFKPFDAPHKLAVATLLGFPSYFMLSHQCNLLKRVCEGKKSIDPKHE